MPPAASYPGSLADINYAIRWLKADARRLGGKPDKIGLVGISSGGHQAMLAAMRPADPRYGAIARPEAAGQDARVGAVVLCWPVIDPLGRYRYAKAAIAGCKLADFPQQLPGVVPSHDKYWGSEAAMEEGSPALILERGEAVELPPVLCVQGDADRMHPRPHLDRFVELYRRRGGRLELALYPGEVEGFVTRAPRDPRNQQAGTERIIEFVLNTLA
jgi:acetyl esterase/lipase